MFGEGIEAGEEGPDEGDDEGFESMVAIEVADKGVIEQEVGDGGE